MKARREVSDVIWSSKARCANSHEDPCQLEKAKLDQKTAECNAAQATFEQSFCDGAKQAE